MTEKKYNPKGRYQPNGPINKKNDQEKRMANSGRHRRQEKEWTNEEDNKLLEGFLVHRWSQESVDGRPSYHNQLQRTWEGCKRLSTARSQQPQ